VREEDNVLLIKGAIPGSKGDYVVIRESKKLSREQVARIKARAEARAKSGPAKKGAAKPAAAPKPEAKPAAEAAKK